MLDDQRPPWPPPSPLPERGTPVDAIEPASDEAGPSPRLSRIVGLPMLIGVAVLAAALRFGVRRELCVGSGATSGDSVGRQVIEGCRPGQRDHLVGAAWVLPVMVAVGSAMFLLLMAVPLLARRLERSSPSDS